MLCYLGDERSLAQKSLFVSVHFVLYHVSISYANAIQTKSNSTSGILPTEGLTSFEHLTGQKLDNVELTINLCEYPTYTDFLVCK